MAESRPERRRLRLWPRAVLLAAALAGCGLLTDKARAQDYPWCSNFADGAGTNCGFSSEAQCRVTIQGSGGYCDRNTQYRGPAVAPARPQTRPQGRTRSARQSRHHAPSATGTR